MASRKIRRLETIAWKNKEVRIIDQTKLPGRLEYIQCATERQIWNVIRTLKIRGAPAIGAAAAFGMVLGIARKKYSGFADFQKKVNELFSYLASARPTAVNLIWALERMKKVVLHNKAETVEFIQELMQKEAEKIIEEDKLNCRNMAGHAQKLIKNNDRIMTYCNAGILATVDYGTALGCIYRAQELGKNLKVYACETRPLLQGARLTSWELNRNKVNVTLICDNMAGSLMRQKKIDKVFIGADRIAANGDAANKIGSYPLAVLARYHNIPFYVVAPHSTFDLSIKNGEQIPIEERDSREIKEMWYKKPMVPKKVTVCNPAFDVVTAELISAIVTQNAVITPPYRKNIKCFVNS